MIRNFLDQNKKRRLTVFVVGDCMVDEYYSVSANRISPEFPIQVLRSDSGPPLAVPGGAANVAHQFKHFNVDCHLFGCLNDYAREVYARFPFQVHSVNGKTVPIKRRLYDGNHPLTRWDIEDTTYGIEMSQVTDEFVSLFQEQTKKTKPDFVIFADYNKGLFHQDVAAKLIQICRENHIRTIVDPKEEMGKWKGCTYFKPNAKEAKAMTVSGMLWSQILEIKQQTECEAVIVTQSGEGVHIYNGSGTEISDRNYQFIEGKERFEVQSVIGAGDCFSAFLAMGLCHFNNIENAVKLAYDAGCIYVQNRYNTPINRFDLIRYRDAVGAKVIDVKDLPDLTGKDVVVTNGCFDLLHAGHVELLNWAKAHGDVLIVAVNDDESVQRLKGEFRPINSIDKRLKLLSNLQCVDFVFPFKEDTPQEIYQQIADQIGQFRFLVKGGDYVADDVVGRDLATEVAIFPTVVGLSTTNILEKVKCTHS